MPHRVTLIPGDGENTEDLFAWIEAVTYDMKPHRNDPTAVGTSEVADAIIDKLGVRA